MSKDVGSIRTDDQSKHREVDTVVYLNSEEMGQGDPVLGQKLMGPYLNTLTEFVGSISHILLVNAAVKMICSGSANLEMMQEFHGAGVKILACGTCINHFNLADSVEVGLVSNMYEIVSIQMQAHKLLSP